MHKDTSVHHHRHTNTLFYTLLLVAMAAVCPYISHAADCSKISTGLIPINDLANGLYLGQYEGGLYPGGLNTPPPLHHELGIYNARRITRLDQLGTPDPNGSIVLLSIGMSNTTQEFCSSGGLPCSAWSFTGQALMHPQINPSGLIIVNGAKGAQVSETWNSPADENYDRVRDRVLMPLALTESQVQVVWVKQARPRPNISLPDSNSDAFVLLKDLGDIARAVKVRYPNVQQMFLSSRIYAGYASTLLNPEPYAYETGFAVKWLIEAQIRQRDSGVIDPIAGDLSDTVAPWLGWSAYLWADGESPRSDGLSWTCSDFDTDGTHPAQPAEEKVGKLLLDSFIESPYSQPWFTVGEDQAPDEGGGGSGTEDGSGTEGGSGAVDGSGALDELSNSSTGSGGCSINGRKSKIDPVWLVIVFVIAIRYLRQYRIDSEN